MSQIDANKFKIRQMVPYTVVVLEWCRHWGYLRPELLKAGPEINMQPVKREKSEPCMFVLGQSISVQLQSSRAT